VNGTEVRATKTVIDETLQAIARRREALQAQDKEPGPPSTKVNLSVSGQAIWCCDAETDRIRPATEADIASFSRVVGTFSGLGRTHPTFIPQDVPLPTQDLHTLVTILLNSEKPLRVDVYSPEMLPYFLEAYSIYYGSEEKGREAMGSDNLSPAIAYINTPFILSREVIEAAMRLREMTGRPLQFGHMPVMGVSTPVTHAGALALSTAEAIGFNAITLAVDGRIQGWSGPGLCSVDMKTLLTTQWSPEITLTQAGARYVVDALFGDRTAPSFRHYVGAKRPGAQSMMERAFGLGMGFMAGARSFGGLGILAFADIGSVVQLMLDMELGSMVQKMAEGFSVDADLLAEEVIREVVPKGARFIETEHTARYFRQALWMPELMNREVATAALEGETTMLDAARAKALHLMGMAPNLCPLDEGQRRALQELVGAADREFG